MDQTQKIQMVNNHKTGKKTKHQKMKKETRMFMSGMLLSAGLIGVTAAIFAIVNGRAVNDAVPIVCGIIMGLGIITAPFLNK